MRQGQVLDALAEGKTNAQIAQALGISLNGVKWHISELLMETGLHDRSELADWWRRQRSRRTWSFFPRLGLNSIAAGGIVVVAGAVLILFALALDSRGRDLPPDDLLGMAPKPIEEPGTHGSKSVGPPPPCNSPLSADFRIVSGDDLRAEGLIKLGGILDPGDCQLRVSNRAERAVVWLADETVLESSQDDAVQVGGYGIGVSSAARLLLSYNSRSFQAVIAAGYRGVDDALSPTGGGRIQVDRLDSGGIYLTFLGQSQETGKLLGHRLALDSEGNLFFDPEPVAGDVAYNEVTGEPIDITGLTKLTKLDVGQTADFAFTYCDLLASGCQVTYRDLDLIRQGDTVGRLLAPVDGMLRCVPEKELTFDDRYDPPRPIGEWELDAGDFRLRISEAHASGTMPLGSWACEPRQVEAGDIISAHSHHQIAAVTPDGRPLSVVVSEDGTLYVGEVSLTIGCPCLSGH